MPALGKECVSQEFDQIAVLVKQETVYSDDSLPTPAEAVLMTGAPTLSIVGNKVERDIAKPFWGNDMHQTTDRFVTLSGEVEVAGPGIAGALPGAASLLRACGLAEVQNVGTSVVYTPASENIPSLTSYFYHDKDLWKVPGMRGNAKLSMSAGQFAKWMFDMTGLFQIPEDNPTLPVIPAQTDADPLVLNYNNTPTATFFGENVDVNSFELDFGMTVKSTDRPGCLSVQHNDRKPSGSITISSPRINAQDIRDLASRYQTGAIALQHGVDDGQIMALDLAKVQMDLTGIQESDIGDNEKGIVIPFMPLPTVGDDEWIITYR